MIRQSSTPQPAAPSTTPARGVRSSRHPVVAATVRLWRELRREFDAAQVASGRVVWDTPEILPLDAWLGRCFREWLYARPRERPIQLLRLSEERAIWEDIVRSSPEGGALLQIAATADVAFEAWNLACRWRLPFDATEWNDTGDSEAFHGWAMEYLRRLDRKRWLSNAQLAAFLAERVDDGEISVPERIVLAGFLERTPVENKLFKAFEGAGCAIEDREAEVGGEAMSASGGVRLDLADREAEIQAVAVWARRRLEEASLENRGDLKIGVVVPDLGSCRTHIDRVLAEVFHPDARLRPDLDPHRLFNISLGPRLRDYPLVDAALRILSFKPQDNAIEEIGRLLRCRFVAGAEDEFTRRALLDRRLRELREPRVGLPAVLRLAGQDDAPHCCRVLAGRLSRWQQEYRDLPGEQMPSDWAASASVLLKAMGWPGDRTLSSVEYQTASAWNDLLSEFAGLDGVFGPVSPDRAWTMVERLASARQFQPESDPAPIQVLGVFEASGLRFDHLWLMGADDGAWPAPSSPHPFLPLRLQRDSKVPGSSPVRELEFSRLLTRRILASAPGVVVSCPVNDGDTALRPSPLFAHLPESSVEELDVQPDIAYLERLRQSSDMETVEHDVAPPWNILDGERASGGTSIFKWQAACPFRAFAHLRLGADAMPSAEAGLDAIDRGVLIHEALDRVWRQLRSHRGLTAADPEHVAAIVEGAAGAALQSMSEHRAVLRQPRFAEIERARLTRLIGDWLELEKQRQPFTVIDQESRRQVEVGGVRFEVRADRVDRIEDGTAIVVDYKTGVHGPAEWEGDRPDEPQLPLYAVTAPAPVSGVFFGVLKTGNTGFRGTAVSEDLVPGVRVGENDPDMQERIGDWRGALDRLGRDFMSGVATVDPKKLPKTCMHCSLPSLCRIDELTGAAVEGDLD